MNTNPIRKNLPILRYIDEAKVDATTEEDIAKHQLQDEVSEFLSTSLIRHELEDLIRAIDTKNLHGEIDFKSPFTNS
jgi:hypothetical protein